METHEACRVFLVALQKSVCFYPKFGVILALLVYFCLSKAAAEVSRGRLRRIEKTPGFLKGAFFLVPKSVPFKMINKHHRTRMPNT